MIDSNNRLGIIHFSFKEFAVIDFTEEIATLSYEDLRIAKTVDGRYDFQNLKGISEPTAYDLRKIEALQPSGLPPLTAADGVILSYIAADNMIDRSLARWPVESLQKNVDLSIERPLILNHDDSSVETVQALIFDAGIATDPNPDRRLTDTGYSAKYNRQIAKKEGYVALIHRAFAPIDSSLIKRMRYGVGSVSMGYSYGDIRCPECGHSFYDEACPHYVPLHPEDREEEGYARYRDKVDPLDLHELSLVVTPNLPKAGVLRNYHTVVSG